MNAVIDFNSKITLKLVIEVIVVVVAVTSMWFNLRAELKDVNNTLADINKRLLSMESGDWQAREDYIFMRHFSDLNKLQMPTHKGDN